ncbi:MAG: ASPIC/UnbV domain-containing protein [Planctomycetales bacterium]|nr:ASPIC/UnbV domain-containing protein [Planctomycetales bacterium]
MSQEGGAAPIAMGAGAAGASAELLRFIRHGRSFSGREPHCFFLNMQDGSFADLSSAAQLNLPDDGRATGFVDWDHDGDLDMWISNRNGPQLRFLENRLPNQNQSLQFRLQGTSSNRDAIGARLILTDSTGQQQIKTLRAGDGYLAQSSKTIHFGLPAGRTVQQLEVRWPSGSVETWNDLETNQFYSLVEGQMPVVVRQASTPIAETANKLAGDDDAVEETIRVLSISDVPVPKLAYVALDQSRRAAFQLNSQHLTLVNLFATWCAPCQVELAELAARAADLRQANCQVVAVCVDPLDPDSTVTAKDIEALLQKHQFPFEKGIATKQLVESLQLLNNHLFDLHLPLPVPTSVLVDERGKLVAMYKGAVKVDTVLSDIALSQKQRNERRADSAPFAGRWFEPLNRTSHVPLLDELIQANLLDEADDFVRRIDGARKQNLLPSIVRLASAFFDHGNLQKAQEHFQVVLRMEPTYPGVDLALAARRLKEGNVDLAARHYQAALQRSPNNITALNDYAWLLATHAEESARNGKKSVELAAHAVELSHRKRPAILGTLSAAFAEVGDFEQALQLVDEAIAVAESQGKIQLLDSLQKQRVSLQANQPIRDNSAAAK